MEHSNSSNSSNSNQNNIQPSVQDNQQDTTQETLEQAPKPTKPLKITGKYQPKNSTPASPAQDNSYQQPEHTSYSTSSSTEQQPYFGQPPYGQQQPYGQAPYVQQPPFNGAGPGQPQNGKLKHGGLGIASFILSLLSLASVVIGFIVMISSVIGLDESDLLMFQSPNPEYFESMINSADSIPSFAIAILIGGFLMLASAGLSFIGFVLGLISLFIKHRKKVFGILGTIFNGLLLFGGVILFIISVLSGLAI